MSTPYRDSREDFVARANKEAKDVEAFSSAVRKPGRDRFAPLGIFLVGTGMTACCFMGPLLATSAAAWAVEAGAIVVAALGARLALRVGKKAEPIRLDRS